MLKQIFKFSLILPTLALLCIFSCQKDDVVDVENFTDETIGEMQDRAGCGKHGCFEFVFPLTIEFPDGTTAEVEDYVELHDVISTWKMANPDSEEKPGLVFPIDIMTKTGEIITLETQEELRDLRIRCHRFFNGHGPRGHHGEGYACFSLVFPVALAYPDGTTSNASSKKELKQLLRVWRANHTPDEGRPVLVFPLDVQLEDETIITLETKDALTELKDSCGE